LLGIPPHRVACTFGIHDDGRVGAFSHWRAIGVIKMVAR